MACGPAAPVLLAADRLVSAAYRSERGFQHGFKVWRQVEAEMIEPSRVDD